MTRPRSAFKTASSRRAWLATAVIGIPALTAGAWWGVTALQTALKPADVPSDDADFCIVAPPIPYNSTSGLPVLAARPVPDNARCPVCGMYPARSPDWAAQVIFSNGDVQFFDSPLSLFMYLAHVERYSPGRHAGEIVARYVTDVTSRTWISAEKSFFVHGSTARGPMRAGNLPAFASLETATGFAAQRGGKVLTYNAIDAKLIATLATPLVHSH